MILTVSRMDAEKQSNPGYRAFLANGDNVTRTLVLFGWEVVLEWIAAARAIRRDVRPRGHRGGIYPLMRGALCVFVRDLIVSGVLTDMMRGRPAVYATFSSYDEVAHHSGLERADTLEALRKLDAQLRADRARPPLRAAPVRDRRALRPRPDAGRDLQAAQRLRPRRARRALARHGARSPGSRAATSRARWSASPSARPPARRPRRPRTTSPTATSSCSAPGNLGLVYLMEERRRLTLEEIDARHPKLLPALRAAPARRLAARPLLRARAGRARRPRHPLPRRRAHRGRGPARAVLAHRARAPPAHRRLRACRRHHGRQLLRPRARRGLRLRGADLLPRRDRRRADAPVHPPPARTSRCPPGPSSAPRACTPSSPAGARRSRPTRRRRARTWHRHRPAVAEPRSASRGEHARRAGADET